jgi:hypothetical protein
LKLIVNRYIVGDLMQQAPDTLDFHITIESPETDIQEMEQLTLELRQELLDLNVENVDLIRERDIPDRAKAIEPISWGALLVKLASSVGILTMLIKTLECWLKRHQTSSITIEYEGNKLSVNGFIQPEERQRLIDNWIKTVLDKES